MDRLLTTLAAGVMPILVIVLAVLAYRHNMKKWRSGIDAELQASLSQLGVGTHTWEPEDRPELFAGAVEVEARSHDAVPQPEAPLPDAESDFDGPSFPPDDQPPPSIPDFNQPLFDLIDAPSPEPSTPRAKGGNRAAEALPDFIDWLKAGLADRSLKINDSKAMVHSVDGTLFLVTPQLFQQCASLKISATDDSLDNDAEWRLLQKQFEKLKLHRKQHDGTNIWTCQARGPRKQSYLKGYLLQSPKTVIETLPPDNSFLSLSPDQGLAQR